MPDPLRPRADRGHVTQALAWGDRPRARGQHRRSRHGAGRDRGPEGRVEVEVALTIAGCPLRTQLRSRCRAPGREPARGARASRVAHGGDGRRPERSAVMDRARRRAQEDRRSVHRHPRHRAGAGRGLGQGRCGQVVGHGQPGRRAGPAGASRSASSTPTSGGSRFPACSACRASSRAEDQQDRAPRASRRRRAARRWCRWGSSPTRTPPSCGGGSS